MNDSMFDIVTERKRGKTMTRFIEKDHPVMGYCRGKTPITYHYAHDSGNMRMTHDQLYAAREIMARSESGQRAGAKAAIPNDVEAAAQIAFDHICSYRGDGMDHSERQIEALRRRGLWR